MTYKLILPESRHTVQGLKIRWEINRAAEKIWEKDGTPVTVTLETWLEAGWKGRK